MDWDNEAAIGYSASGDPYGNNDPSSNEVACVNHPDSDWSNVIYQLSEGTPEDPPAGNFSLLHHFKNSTDFATVCVQRMSQSLILPTTLPQLAGQYHSSRVHRSILLNMELMKMTSMRLVML